MFSFHEETPKFKSGKGTTGVPSKPFDQDRSPNPQKAYTPSGSSSPCCRWGLGRFAAWRFHDAGEHELMAVHGVLKSGNHEYSEDLLFLGCLS